MLWSKAIGAGGAGGAVEGWNVSTAVFLQNFSVAAQDKNPRGVFFKLDGLKMYVSRGTAAAVLEYNLSTAWDISTAVFFQSVSTQAIGEAAIGPFFKPDGLKMYLLKSGADQVAEFNLSTAWDISTAVFLHYYSVAGQDTNPSAMFFKPDGLKMYILGNTGDDINEYNLSTAWDISTAVFLQRFSLSSFDTIPSSLFFKPDGLKMYFIGNSNDFLREFNLGTAWDISTAVFFQNFSIGFGDPTNTGLFFKPDGLKMYFTESTNDRVYEYDLTA